MRILFALSKENTALAVAEIEELLKTKAELIRDDVAAAEIAGSDCGLLQRLAMARTASEILIFCREEELGEKISAHNFNFKGSYCAALNKGKGKIKLTPASIGSMIWKNLERTSKPEVSMKNPDEIFDTVIDCNGIVYFCRRVFTNTSDYEARESHKRPGHHPSSLHPKLARCLVNLSGARKEVLDPLCGTGGFMIEAGLMGLKAKGMDIDKKLLALCRKNIEFFKINGAETMHGDATALSSTIPRAEAIVTDFPYGLHSRAPKNIENFYIALLKEFSKVTHHAVVMMPNFMDGEAIIAQTPWAVKRSFSWYVHKFLTRRIFVISNQAKIL